ncbi:hypothetical protein Tco_1284802 [Tanacetum coccineum]
MGHVLCLIRLHKLLWNHFDKNEGNTLAGKIGSGVMIFSMRLKVTTFNCLSLSTRGSSRFMIDPPVTHEYNANKAELEELLNKNSDILLPYPKDENIISLSTPVASLRTVSAFAAFESRMTIQIDDETTILYATIGTSDVEKIMPYTAVEVKDDAEHVINLHDDIAASVHKHTIVAFIRSYEATFCGHAEMKVSVIKDYTLDKRHASNLISL